MTFMSVDRVRGQHHLAILISGMFLLGGCAAENQMTKEDKPAETGAAKVDASGTETAKADSSGGAVATGNASGEAVAMADTSGGAVAMPAEKKPGGDQDAMKPEASATIEARSGSQVSGTVNFYALPGGGSKVVVDLSGLTPGPHGIHVHEKGDCSAPDAASAGAHWNPTGVAHGAPGKGVHHAGDFGNLEAGADGKAHLVLESSDFTVDGGQTVVGHAIIIHEKLDDLTSQPAGNAGNRIGCGVIGKK